MPEQPHGLKIKTILVKTTNTLRHQRKYRQLTYPQVKEGSDPLLELNRNLTIDVLIEARLTWFREPRRSWWKVLELSCIRLIHCALSSIQFSRATIQFLLLSLDRIQVKILRGAWRVDWWCDIWNTRRWLGACWNYGRWLLLIGEWIVIVKSLLCGLELWCLLSRWILWSKTRFSIKTIKYKGINWYQFLQQMDSHQMDWNLPF